MGVGDQLISFQPQYRNVFSNLLGRVVVMEDLDHAIAAARKYGYKFRIVTLDGQVLNPGGSMTGGSASRSAGILSRANELERLNEQGRGLREQLAQAAKALEEADREAAAAGYEMETAQRPAAGVGGAAILARLRRGGRLRQRGGRPGAPSRRPSRRRHGAA